jgi:hypothetical protein
MTDTEQTQPEPAPEPEAEPTADTEGMGDNAPAEDGD